MFITIFWMFYKAFEWLCHQQWMLSLLENDFLFLISTNFFNKTINDNVFWNIYIFLFLLNSRTSYFDVTRGTFGFFTPTGPPHPLSWGGGGGGQSQILKREDQKKKMSAWGVLKSPCHRYLPRGLLCFLSKKDFVKLNIVLKAKFSNVNLGLC